MNTWIKMRSGNTQVGMTLLEVIVSMLVIGLALAMSISMIQTANRFGESAEFTSSALRQAQVIADKMRANNREADSYLYPGAAAITPDATFSDIHAALDMSYLVPCGAECTEPSDHIAREDMLQWVSELSESLPQGRGAIVANGQRRYDVVVTWSHTAENGEMQDNPDAQGVRITFAL